MYEESVVKVREKPFHERSTMGPQTEAEGNVPKDGDPSEEELPPVPAGTFLGLQDDEAGSSDDAEEDGDGVDRGGYQLLNGDIDAEGCQSDNDEEEEGWARFDQMPTTAVSDGNSQSLDSRINVDWPNGGDPSQTSVQETIPPASPSDFLAGGAHLLPPGLRDAPPPRVASLSEGVREVWAGRRNDAADLSCRNMGKVEDIRQAMAKITLPKTAVPEWANQLSDDEWRKALDERLNLSKK